jgi:hypothetical protein
MNRRGFSSGLLRFGLFSSIASRLPQRASAVDPQVSDRDSVTSTYSIEVDNLTVHFDNQGKVMGAEVGPRKLPRRVLAETTLAGCNPTGSVKPRRLNGGGIEFSSTLLKPDRREFSTVQRFLPAQRSVRWEIEITCDGEPWAAPIDTTLRWPTPATAEFWTAWLGGDDVWTDPLLTQPMSNCSWACSWMYGPYASVGGFCIPLASVLESHEDTGLSVVLSPEDPLLELTLTNDAEGAVCFRRENLRLGQGRTVKIAADLVAHEADWRGGLRWMVQRYPDYFEPPNPKVQEMAGTGAYSHWEGPLDAARLEQMAYRVLWEAAFDWPYMGMYFPPVDNNTTWWTAGYDSSGNHLPELVKQVSYRTLNDRARKLGQHGFYYLNYANLAVWGWRDVFNLKVINRNLPQQYAWMDPVTFLQEKVADGIWRDEGGKESLLLEGTLVMDSEGANYQADILNQFRRAMEKIPDSWGFAIDRTWWGVDYTTGGARTVNYAANDSVGWYHGRSGRHHSVTFRDTLSKLGPVVHGKGKVIFYNPCMSYRLDLMRDIDGFFGEIWPTAHGYTCLNGTGFLALRKPGIVWTVNTSTLKPDPNAYFQRHLYMGVYPMVPYPKNDHSITPDPESDTEYLKYGPLMAAMRGKKWVLEPHCMEVENQAAKANLFTVPGGWVAPITFGPTAGKVTVALRNVPGLEQASHYDALLPGVPGPQAVTVSARNGTVELQVPLRSGCAMVRIKSKV